MLQRGGINKRGNIWKIKGTALTRIWRIHSASPQRQAQQKEQTDHRPIISNLNLD
jgi:hypothetical protein